MQISKIKLFILIELKVHISEKVSYMDNLPLKPLQTETELINDQKVNKSSVKN